MNKLDNLSSVEKHLRLFKISQYLAEFSKHCVVPHSREIVYKEAFLAKKTKILSDFHDAFKALTELLDPRWDPETDEQLKAMND